MEPISQPAPRIRFQWAAAGLLSLSLALILLATSQPQAQGPADYALRYYGHGVGAPGLDRVRIPIDPPVPLDVGGDFTLEFWMKAGPGDNGSPPCAPGNDGWIYGNIILDRDVFGDGDNGDYGLSLSGGRIAFGVHNGSWGDGLCSLSDLADGQWHHLAVTRRMTGEMGLFVDGIAEAQASGPPGDVSYRDGRSTSYPDSDPYLVIGAEKHDAGAAFPSFSGWIDELRVSDTVRYSVNFIPPAAPFSPDGNTVALYHFDEGPAGPCSGAILDSAGAPGGPSPGSCHFGGSPPAGPEYVTDTPWIQPPCATPPGIFPTPDPGSLPPALHLPLMVNPCP